MQPIINMPEEDRATDIGNMYKKYGKVRACGSGDILADRQTHKQTILITILRNRSRSEVNKQRAVGTHVLKEQNTVFGVMD